MDFNWIEGEAKKGKEIILPMRHLKQSEWQREWNTTYGLNSPHRYDYISDYECFLPHPVKGNDFGLPEDVWESLQQAKEEGMSVPIEKLAHFTNPNSAEAIQKDGGFIGGRKKINDEHHAYLSWWSPIFERKDATNTVRANLKRVIRPLCHHDNELKQLLGQFAQSDAFHPNPIRGHGSEYFTYGIQDVCKYYQRSINEQLQFKILGTFLYKNEIMHAVVVCGETAGNELFQNYPPVPEKDATAVVTRDTEGNWEWHPQATATEIRRLSRFQNPQYPNPQYQYPRYRRWEHLAFAFHSEDIIHVKNIEQSRKTLQNT